MSQYFGQTLFGDISSIFLRVPNLSNNARTIKKKNPAAAAFVTLIY